MMIKTAVVIVVCLLASAVNAATLTPGTRISINQACVTADDALEVGVSIDRKLSNVADMLHDKIVNGACFVLVSLLRHDDATLVNLIDSAENTDVWEVRTDTGRTLYVLFDREPSL